MNTNQALGTDKNIKIYKSATHVSILDVQSALDYHQTRGDDVVYKGNLVFVINEYGRSKIQLQAFLPKATAKMVTHLIQNHMFHNVFPQGFKQYGGSPKTKRARVLTIAFEQDKARYKFQIEEGKGQVIKNGAMKMVQRDKSVQTYVSLQDSLELSHEVLDFIRHEELISLMNNKPLFSYSTFQPNANHNNGQNNQSNRNSNQQQNRNQQNNQSNRNSSQQQNRNQQNNQNVSQFQQGNQQQANNWQQQNNQQQSQFQQSNQQQNQQLFPEQRQNFN